ncbi:MAG: hypothetical protein AAGD10_01545 [Myxococcota bacterium]
MSTSILLLPLLLPGVATEPGAGLLDTVGTPTVAHVDPECDRLFGDVEQRAENELSRARRLVMVREGPSYIDVVQTGGWDDPTEIAIRGLSVVETSIGEGTAVIQVLPELGFCEPGEYEVHVDDAIGSSGRILAVFDSVVMIEHEGALRFLRLQGSGARPVFKVSWQSRFAVVAPTKSAGPSRAAKSRRRRKQ